MKCEVCGNDIGEVVVPLPLKRADGSLNAMACLKCAEKSTAYCLKHKRPHLGFFDDTTACIYCIEEMVDENRDKADRIFSDLREKLLSEEFEKLLDWASTSSSVSGSSRNPCILRVIAAKAKRSNQTIEEVLKKIIETRSVEYILPYVPLF